MNWLVELFSQGSVAQTILIVTLISIVGLALGRIKFGTVSFGSSFVFFAAIAAGHFINRLGFQTDTAMLDFVKNFGLVVFVYMLGLQVGPGFYASLRKGGGKVILSSLCVIALGSIMTVLFAVCTNLSGPEAVGLLSGSVTSTPSLISAQQTVLDIDNTAVETSSKVAAAYAVAYPFSVLGVICSIILLKFLFRNTANAKDQKMADRYTAVTEVRVTNRSVFDKSVHDVVSESGFHFVISRLWRDQGVVIPVSDTLLRKGDHLLIICDKDDIHKFGDIFGREEDKDWNRPDIDWNILDKNLISKHVRVTLDSVVGMTLGQLKLRNKFGVNITRLNRAGITLVPNAETSLQFGDRLTVVGDEDKIKALGKALGNEEKRLNDPHLIPILGGIFLGVFLGCIPIYLPVMSMPLKLGIAGGPIIMGILMGALGPKFHITTYTTRSANFMLRDMGITCFFAALGLSVGKNFVDTVFCTQGLKWAAMAVLLSSVPVILMGIVNEKLFRFDIGRNFGVLCGSMTNPNALNYSNSITGNDNASEAYATVYPLVTFLRVFIAQILVIALGL